MLKNARAALELTHDQPLPSFPRKRESILINGLWIPALRFATAGMTSLEAAVAFSAAC
jgi:hypothetical protein